MTDDDLLETVRSELAEIRLGAPAQDVMARGNALRRHRRMLPAVGAGAGVAAAAGLALGLAVAGATHANLDAWTVTKLPNKTVTLTIRDAAATRHDPLGLSRALAAVGVPAVVRTGRPVCLHATLKLMPVEVPKVSLTPVPKEYVIRFKPRTIPKGTRVAIMLPVLARPVRVLPGTVHRRHVRSVALRPYVYLLKPSSRCATKQTKH